VAVRTRGEDALVPVCLHGQDLGLRGADAAHAVKLDGGRGREDGAARLLAF
jgi:hypothetical protein